VFIVLVLLFVFHILVLTPTKISDYSDNNDIPRKVLSLTLPGGAKPPMRSTKPSLSMWFTAKKKNTKG
jgi:hypothetical protein